MASQQNTVSVSRSASWIGGIALLLIAVLAAIGNFVALAPLITTGDPAATAAAISGSETQFRLGVLCMALAAVLDVVVAAALLRILEPVNRMVAVTGAWFRIAYAAVFLVAIAGLGYLADGIGTILVPDYVATISTFTFIGEVALIGWLLWKAIRGPGPQAA